MIMDQLKKACKKKGVTLAKLADDLDLSKSVVYSWIRAYPSVSKLKILSEYLGCSIDYLLGQDVLKDENRLAISNFAITCNNEEARKAKEFIEFIEYKRIDKNK